MIRIKNADNRMEEHLLDGVYYLTFPIITQTGAVRHLFSTRLGGVSQGHLGSMNLSYTRGDCKENVDENFRRIANVLGCGVQDFVLSDQTHTTNIRYVNRQDKGKGILCPRDYHDIDGLITDDPEIVLAAFYADCVPLFFVDPVKKAIGLAHSGWRGTVGRIGKNTVEAMQMRFGSNPQDIIAAIGPSICRECYEVKWDVAKWFCEEFKKEMDDIVIKKQDGSFRLDLWKANYEVLTESGILPEHISVTDICTCHNPDLLFSHRASNGKRGNLGAFLGLLK